MEHYLQRIPFELRWQVLVPLLLTVGVIGWGFFWGANPLGAPNLVALEIARKPDRAKKIVAGWHEKGHARPALIGIGIDFLFLLIYSTIIACCCAWYAGTLRGGFAVAGVVLAWLQWVTALCDMAENFFLFQMVMNTNGEGAEACTIVSLIKWILALAGLVYVVVAMIVRCRDLLPNQPAWGAATGVGAVIIAASVVLITIHLWRAWQGD